MLIDHECSLGLKNESVKYVRMSAAHILKEFCRTPARALLPGKYRHSKTIPQTNLLSCTRSKPNLIQKNDYFFLFFKANTIFPLKRVPSKDSCNSCLSYMFTGILQFCKALLIQHHADVPMHFL